jgi:hypothetical protein
MSSIQKSVKPKASKIGKVPNFRFIVDKFEHGDSEAVHGTFIIEPAPQNEHSRRGDNDSIYLYIEDGQIIEEGTPLDRFIKLGLIVEETPGFRVVIETKLVTRTYKKYKFYRLLLDERTYVNSSPSELGQPIDDEDKKNENDCLKVGECLAAANQLDSREHLDKMLAASSGPPVLTATISNGNEVQFGDSDEQNMDILDNYSSSQKNENAAPLPGECYAIVRKQIEEDRAPYHIAFVLYTHNGVNITLEASADTGAEYYPRFSFYDTSANGKTFHTILSQYYTNSDTIVLKPRDITVVLEEIANESAAAAAATAAAASVGKKKISASSAKKGNKKGGKKGGKKGSKKSSKKGGKKGGKKSMKNRF